MPINTSGSFTQLGKKYGLDKMVKEFKVLLVETFKEQCSSGIHILNYHLLDHMVKNLQLYERLKVSDSRPYEYSTAHNDQA